jgi:hypothetical protein
MFGQHFAPGLAGGEARSRPNASLRRFGGERPACSKNFSKSFTARGNPWPARLDKFGSSASDSGSGSSSIGGGFAFDPALAQFLCAFAPLAFNKSTRSSLSPDFST